MTALPQAELTDASRASFKRGVKILQGYRLAASDVAHTDALLDFMAPAYGTRWADIGCGFGEPARLMHRRRPDLDFVLINNNGYQLDASPASFRKVRADMHALPLHTGEVDGCMFLYALCHADPLHQALREAARITAPGGGLFVFDYARLAGDNRLMREKLYAEAIAFDEMRAIAEAVGWHVTGWDAPDGDDALFRELYGDPIEYALIFTSLVPVLWRAVRR